MLVKCFSEAYVTKAMNTATAIHWIWLEVYWIRVADYLFNALMLIIHLLNLSDRGARDKRRKRSVRNPIDLEVVLEAFQDCVEQYK